MLIMFLVVITMAQRFVSDFEILIASPVISAIH